MANTSIYAAFERLWQHIVVALGNKADVNHTHTEIVSSPWTLDESTGCFYRMVDSERYEQAQEKEWLNPPLSDVYYFVTDGSTSVIAGEYRTAERYGGKPVYTCIIDTGTGVSGSSDTKEFSVPFLGTPTLIRDSGFAINQTSLEGRALPYCETPKDNGVYWSVHAERDLTTTPVGSESYVKIIERSHYPRTDWKVYAQIWYTYDTPFKTQSNA